MKRRIRLTEDMLREMVRKTISEELSRLDEAKHNYGKYIRKAIYDYLVKNRKIEKITDFVNPSEEQLNDLIADIPQVRDIEKKFLGNFMHGYSNYKDPIKRLAPIFVRIALENNWGKFTQNNDVIRGLRKILRFLINRFKKGGGGDVVIKTDFDEEGNVVKNYYLRDISNNITYNELKNLCSGAFISNGTPGNSDLKIEDIDYSNTAGYDIEANITFERANELGKLSGFNGKNILCYTENEDTWNQYTNSGENTVYVLLKKGYENMNAEEYDEHEKRPYDPYGLSMIFLFVDPNGDLVYSNVRWNHLFEHLGGNRTDENFTKSEIDRITGLSFDEHFINVSQKNQTLTKIENILAGNEQEDDDENLFMEEPLDGSDGRYSVITMCNPRKVNIYDNVDKRFLFSIWFAKISELFTGNNSIIRYLVVTDNHDYNILTPEGNLLFDGDPRDWPSSIEHFYNGFAEFSLADTGCNYVDLNGNILYEPDNPGEWFDYCYPFNEYGLAKVQVHYGDKYNYINTKGEIIYSPDDCDGWFDDCDSFYNGFSKVELNGLYNFVNHNGEVIYEPDYPDDWFDECSEFYEGFAVVKKDGYYNFLSENGCILYEPNNIYDWFDSCEYFDRRGVAVVIKDDKFNLLKPDGDLLSPNLWFDDYGYDTDNYFIVWVDEEKYIIDINGNFYDTETMLPIQIPNGDNTAYESLERLKNKIRRFVNEAINSAQDELGKKTITQEEWNKRFFSFVEQAISEIQGSYLSKLGLTVELVHDYDFEDNSWLASYISSLGQIGNRIIPIALNPKRLYQLMRKKGIANDMIELEAQAYVSVGHEIGHGIVDYLREWYDGENEDVYALIKNLNDGVIDEEVLVEEFGEHLIPGITGQRSSDLANILDRI